MHGRRTNQVSGWVRFPIEDPQWHNTHEGGMVVKLVVVERAEEDKTLDGNGFGVCSGAYVNDMLTENFIGDDRRPKPDAQERDDSYEAVLQEEEDRGNWMAYHYPRMNDDSIKHGDEAKYLSRPYLAALVLGSTGWSGSNEDHDYWICRHEDLTQAGKALYAQLQALYPTGELHLLTFLDT